MKRSILSLLAALAIAAWLLSPATEAGAQSKAVGSKMRLEYLMTFHADLIQPVDIGQTAIGHRQIMATNGGHPSSSARSIGWSPLFSKQVTRTTPG